MMDSRLESVTRVETGIWQSMVRWVVLEEPTYLDWRARGFSFPAAASVVTAAVVEAVQSPFEMTTTFLEAKFPTAVGVLLHSTRAMKKGGQDEKD